MADIVKDVQPAYNNALTFLNYANAYLKEMGVKNSDGTDAEFKQIPGSPAWLFALACGQIMTEWQGRLAAAYSALDPTSCTDEQVLVLCRFAGISRQGGTPSSVQLTFQNSGKYTTLVPQYTCMKESVTGNEWVTQNDIAVPPKEKRTVLAYAKVKGGWRVPLGTVFDFVDNAIADMTCTAYRKSKEGHDIESIASLRSRLTNKTVTYDQTTKAIEAIEELAGIEKAYLWTNTNVSETKTLPGAVELPPRTAFLVVKGADYNESIPETYFKWMAMPLLQLEDSEVRTYTRGSTTLPVYYTLAKTQAVYCKVRILKDSLSTFSTTALRNLLVDYMVDIDIGATITSLMIGTVLNNNGYAKVLDSQLSLTGESDSWSDHVTLHAFCYPEMDETTIVIEEVAI